MLRIIGPVCLCLFAFTSIGCKGFGDFMVDALGAVAEGIEISVGPSEDDRSNHFIEPDEENEPQNTQVNDPKAPVIVVNLGDWIKDELD